jgi:hypothetical protein
VLKARLPIVRIKDDPVRWRASLSDVRLVPVPASVLWLRGRRRKVGFRASGPALRAMTPSTMATAARSAASISRSVVSSKWASARIEAAIGVGHVAGVPLFYLVVEGVAVNRQAALSNWRARRSMRALLSASDEQLHVGVGCDHWCRCRGRRAPRRPAGGERGAGNRRAPRASAPITATLLASWPTSPESSSGSSAEGVDRAGCRDCRRLEPGVPSSSRHRPADGAVEQARYRGAAAHSAGQGPPRACPCPRPPVHPPR